MMPTARSRTTPALIETNGLTRVYRKGRHEIRAVDGVDLTIHSGDHVALTGPSGSGKSTLLALLGLLDRATSGSYRLQGTEVGAFADHEASRLRNTGIGFIFQSFHLIPHLSAWQNVAVPLAYATPTPSQRVRRDRALEALERVGLQDHADHLPRQLSGGQEQRVAIARALVTRPSVILADEPTGNLDTRSRDDVLEHLMGARERGVTLVVVTHDPAVAALAPRVVRMQDGTVVESAAA